MRIGHLWARRCRFSYSADSGRRPRAQAAVSA
jgi:hypothetical protein